MDTEQKRKRPGSAKAWKPASFFSIAPRDDTEALKAMAAEQGINKTTSAQERTESSQERF
jgi:hypothetical protein